MKEMNTAPRTTYTDELITMMNRDKATNTPLENICLFRFKMANKLGTINAPTRFIQKMLEHK